MAMVLGTYTFAVDPSTMTPVRAKVHNSFKLTYDSVSYFSWGPAIEGLEVLLEWNYCPTTQWTQLDTIYQADAAVVFDPQDGSSKTYNVRVKELDSKYILLNFDYRQDVKMTLIILSEV